jgi:phage major head subunit gpT-like protein
MITRTQYSDIFLEDALPALRAITMEEFERFPDEYPKVFKVETSSRSIEQFTQLTGFGVLAEIMEGENITFDEPLQGYDKTYRHRKFGRGYRVSQEAFEDDKTRFIKNLARQLGKAADETTELEAALIFNRAFNSSYTGADGKVLCATDHPMVGGGSQANRPTNHVDLDISSLEAALTTFRGWTDHRGKKIRMVPETLLVAGAGEFNAAEILGGTMRSDTANHTINAFRKRSNMKSLTDYMVWDYLTDPDAWFLISSPEDPNYEVRFFWRKKFDTQQAPDFDADGYKVAGRMRFSCGWNDWLGVYGSQGS